MTVGGKQAQDLNYFDKAYKIVFQYLINRDAKHENEKNTDLTNQFDTKPVSELFTLTKHFEFSYRVLIMFTYFSGIPYSLRKFHKVGL